MAVSFAMLLAVVLAFLAVSTTCKTVRFPITLTWETGSPDGQARQMVFTNGQFPGPELRLTEGDDVQVHVTNNLPVDATVHFHGIEQTGTPWSDGVPGLSQKPIPSGGTYLYQWTATQYGQYWYHGHAQGLLSDGLYGPITILPSSNQSSPFSLISSSSIDQGQMEKAESNPEIVLVSDWSKFTSSEYFAAESNSNLDIYCVDSILVNGKGSVQCLSQSELNTYVNPNLAVILKQSNLTVSDKG